MCNILSNECPCLRKGGDTCLKTLIIYATKTGITEECAKTINKKIEDSTLINIQKEKVDIKEYDFIIVGSPIRMGMIDKKIKSFLQKNRQYLKTKKTAYFICCAFPQSFKKYYKENVPQDLLDCAIIYDTFGGQMDKNKVKGLDRLIVELVSKYVKESKSVRVLEENIDQFVEHIKRCKDE